MPESWYRKTRIQVAIIACLGSIFVALISYVAGPIIVEKYRSRPKENREVEKPLGGENRPQPSPPPPQPSSPPLRRSTLDEMLEAEHRNAEAADEARQAHRTRHHVRPLEPEESNLLLPRMPRNTFGFIDGFSVQRYINRSERDFRVTKTQFFKYFEIHKLEDGTLRLLVFVSHDTAVRARLDGPKGVSLTMYSNRWERADELINLKFPRHLSEIGR